MPKEVSLEYTAAYPDTCPGVPFKGNILCHGWLQGDKDTVICDVAQCALRTVSASGENSDD